MEPDRSVNCLYCPIMFNTVRQCLEVGRWHCAKFPNVKAHNDQSPPSFLHVAFVTLSLLSRIKDE